MPAPPVIRLAPVQTDYGETVATGVYNDHLPFEGRSGDVWFDPRIHGEHGDEFHADQEPHENFHEAVAKSWHSTPRGLELPV